MSISSNIPASIETQLRRTVANLDQAAKEAFLVRTYRLGHLTLPDLSQGLGLDRIQTEARLKQLGIFDGAVTLEDLEADRQTLDRLLGPVR